MYKKYNENSLFHDNKVTDAKHFPSIYIIVLSNALKFITLY